LTLLLNSPDALVVWTLCKAGHLAHCIVCPVGDRVELHITMTEQVIVSQQCRGQEQAAFVSNTWLEALRSRGWREGAASNPLELFDAPLSGTPQGIVRHALPKAID
jgi:hypothetical protein